MTAKTKTRKKAKKLARKKTPRTKTVRRPKKLAKKKSDLNKADKKKTSGKKRTRKKSQRLGAPEFSAGLGAGSGQQSGDLQGLSRVEVADSESVNELLEEGNAFEAAAVIGVEDAGSSDEEEVRTHEVSEDDVPSEYLDKD